MRSGARRDCLSPLIYSLLLFVVVFISFGRHFATLTTTVDPGSASRITSAVGAVLQLFLIALPLLPLALFWKNTLYRSIFQAWFLASILSLFYLPALLLSQTAYQAQALLHIVLTCVYIAILVFVKLWRDRRNRIDEKIITIQYHIVEILAVLLIATITALPWLALGAFGSALDTVLGVVYALVFGFAVGLIGDHFLIQPLHESDLNNIGKFWLGGLSFCTVILLAASALAFSFGGIQAILLIMLPGLGWIISALHLILNDQESVRRLKFGVAGLLIGFVALAPLTLIDSDEILLVVMLSPGELLGKAFQATLISTLVIFSISLILFVTLMLVTGSKNRIPDRVRTFSKLGIRILILIVLVGLGLAFAVYRFFGTPGLYGERLFVILKDQADVTLASEIEDDLERRNYVYDTLVAHAEQSQKNLRSDLERYGIQYTPYYLVNGMEVQADSFIYLWLLAHPEVDRVLESPRLRPLPETPPTSIGYDSRPVEPQWNLTSIGADRVWAEFGVTGMGIVIGQSDSGAQYDHPELAHSYRGAKSAAISDHNYNWFDPWNNSRKPQDIGGHGTHTLGSIVGQHTGVAPGATWYACANLARNLGNPALYLDCMQFMLAPFPLDGDPFIDGEPGLGAHIINNSWGCPDIEGCDVQTFQQAVKAMRTAGVFIVVSAGNDGPGCGTLNIPPATYQEVFSVGAIDQFGNIAGFSSIGPVTADGSGRIKPDILAPGVDVLSALPGDTYGRYSGTSMAGPHVAGVVALIWSANPDLSGEIEQTELILIEAAQPYRGVLPRCPGSDKYPSTASGYGLVDAFSAVRIALEK